MFVVVSLVQHVPGRPKKGLFPRKTYTDPVRWVQREFNVTADHLCWLCRVQPDHTACNLQNQVALKQSLEAGLPLQYYSDGSYTAGGQASAAFCVFSWTWNGTGLQAIQNAPLIALKPARYFTATYAETCDCTSSFLAEAHALRLAVTNLAEVARSL
eukprot:TRINITY_DN28467_c0_g1_i3.p1 TRINITY_DN28467_c0_g1~~TRINITY_DN28467_c0_g1_i3.p1  ORF type:complete len:157 (+),score=7.91 TRINITY_DN28467_c0_g1_i3:221-691(+)